MDERSSRFTWIERHLRTVTLADILDARVFGLALSLAWSYVLLFSTVVHFSTRNDVSHFNSVFGFSSVGMLVVLLAGALASSRFPSFTHTRIVRVVVPALMTSTIAVLYVVDLSIVQQPYCSIFATIAGMGMGVLYLAWGESFGRVSSERIVIQASVAFVLAALVFAFVVALPAEAGVGVELVLPPVIWIVLAKSNPGKTAPACEDEPPATLRRGAFLGRALLSLGVLSLTESLIRALFFNASPIINEGSYPWLFLVATLASATIVGVGLFSSSFIDFGLAYKICVYVLAFIVLLLPIVDLGTSLADVLALTVYCTVTLLIWITLARIVSQYHVSALAVFGLGWGAHMVGCLVGTFGGALIGSYVELSGRLLSIIALACVCLVFVGFQFLFGDQHMARLTGEAEVGATNRRRFKACCERVAHEHGLTERETEVMMLVAKGRSTPRIQEALGVTSGTVNTHMSHIYRKLDVHDKQEMLDLLESVA